MPKNITDPPEDTPDFRVFRAIMAEASKSMEGAFGPPPEADANEDGAGRAPASGNGKDTAGWLPTGGNRRRGSQRYGGP